MYMCLLTMIGISCSIQKKKRIKTLSTIAISIIFFYVLKQVIYLINSTTIIIFRYEYRNINSKSWVFERFLFLSYLTLNLKNKGQITTVVRTMFHPHPDTIQPHNKRPYLSLFNFKQSCQLQYPFLNKGKKRLPYFNVSAFLCQLYIKLQFFFIKRTEQAKK